MESPQQVSFFLLIELPDTASMVSLAKMTAPLCTSSLDPQIPPQCFQPTGVGALSMRINVDYASPLETFLFSTVQLT